jgi:hypothetical protein
MSHATLREQNAVTLANEVGGEVKAVTVARQQRRWPQVVTLGVTGVAAAAMGTAAPGGQSPPARA